MFYKVIFFRNIYNKIFINYKKNYAFINHKLNLIKTTSTKFNYWRINQGLYYEIFINIFVGPEKQVSRIHKS